MKLDCDCCHGYRQRRLEEALLFSGQFKDAMQALLDWLYKMETHLAEDQPVHGDLDTVNSLIEEHKVGDRGPPQDHVLSLVQGVTQNRTDYYQLFNWLMLLIKYHHCCCDFGFCDTFVNVY